MENSNHIPNPNDELLPIENPVPVDVPDSPQQEHEAAPTRTSTDIDLDVLRCLRCVVERNPDTYTGIAIAGVAVGQCLEISPQRAVASLKRISYTDQPPIARQRRTLPFRLTAEASQLSAVPTPDSCQKIGPEMIRKKAEAKSTSPQRRLTTPEKVINECVKSIPNAEDQAHAAKKIQLLIDRKIIAVKRTRVADGPSAPGYADRGSWVHLGIGKALTSELEPVQQVVLHHIGVDHLIYGESLDPKKLREDLGFLPLDELSALAKLTLYKIDRKNAVSRR